MLSIEEILKANNYYDEEKKKVNELYEQTCKINDKIDLNEVKNTLDYLGTKNLYKILMYCNNDKEKFNELKAIMKEKKIKEYPQLLDVHYYPIIKNIDFLSDEEKINLDKLIKKCCERYGNIPLLNDLDEKTINFLSNNKIIAKQYIFHCTCGSDECFDKIISQEEYDKFMAYHTITEEQIEKMTDEEYEDYDERWGTDGYFSVGCWNDGYIEVCSVDDFNKHLRRIEYIVIQEPDMTLDNL